jgi:sporulation integral membrane protein YtvI
VVNGVVKALAGWLKAQCIIMSITFTVIITGLSLFRAPNPLLMAIIIAMVDALPVLGSGAVLLPWGIISILTGDLSLGISLILLNVTILLTRHFIEPKIVGTQIGVHPLLTLLGMYIGLQTIGILGMILGPLCIIFLKTVIGVSMKTVGGKNFFKIFDKKEHSENSFSEMTSTIQEDNDTTKK